MHSPASSEGSSTPFDFAPLARRLSTADPHLVVWKGGRDLATQGDLDCSAPSSAWPVLTEAFESWARSQRLAATIACEHALGRLVLVGCGGTAGDRLAQVDLVDELIVHGAPAWKAADAAAASVRAAGITHTLPGAEGILRTLADRADRRSAALVASDPAGAALVAKRLGVRGRLAADSALWSRMALEAVLAARPLLYLASLARALRSDRARNACPVLRALRNERTLAEPFEPWLTAISRTHRVRRVDPT
jgi:hypothetical protein